MRKIFTFLSSSSPLILKDWKSSSVDPLTGPYCSFQTWGVSLPSVSIQLREMLQSHHLRFCSGCCPQQLPPCSSPRHHRNLFPFLDAQLGFATCPGSPALLSLPSSPKLKIPPVIPEARSTGCQVLPKPSGISSGRAHSAEGEAGEVSAPTLRSLLWFVLITGLTGSEEAGAQSHLSILDPLRTHFPQHSNCPEGPTGTKRACCTLHKPDRLWGDLSYSENIF